MLIQWNFSYDSIVAWTKTWQSDLFSDLICLPNIGKLQMNIYQFIRSSAQSFNACMYEVECRSRMAQLQSKNYIIQPLDKESSTNNWDLI